MTKMMLQVVVFGVLLNPAAFAHELTGDSRYLGNEGIMVTVGKRKLLLDAFYAQSFDTYALVPDHMVSAMLAGTPPYDGIDLVFVSHVHGDHFSVAPMLAFLNNQPDVHLICPQQVLDRLQAEGLAAPLAERITAIDIAPGDSAETLLLADVQIEAVALPHAGGERMADIRNLAYRIVPAQGYAFVHLGDAAVDTAAFAALEEFWRARRVQSVFPPYWFFADETGRGLLQEYLPAGQVIGIHVPAVAVGDGERWRSQLDADLFTDPGESRPLIHQH